MNFLRSKFKLTTHRTNWRVNREWTKVLIKKIDSYINCFIDLCKTCQDKIIQLKAIVSKKKIYVQFVYLNFDRFQYTNQLKFAILFYNFDLLILIKNILLNKKQNHITDKMLSFNRYLCLLIV